MHVYFVRHGETTQNIRRRHQSPTTPLSSLGRGHIVTTAEYLRGVNPNLVVTSGYVRTLESARIIGSVLGVPPVVEQQLHEIIRPSKFYDTSCYSLETHIYILFSVLHRNDPDAHYLDGENYTEVMNRAKNMITKLEGYASTKQSIVVVSHTIFINLMLACMCKEKLSLWDIATTFMHIERLRNGAVIHAEYESIGEGALCGWNLRETVLP